MSFEFDKVRNILVCPSCRAELVQDGESLVCTNPDVRLRYAITDGIPRLLVDEATELGPDEWSAVMTRSGRDPATGAATGDEGG